MRFNAHFCWKESHWGNDCCLRWAALLPKAYLQGDLFALMCCYHFWWRNMLQSERPTLFSYGWKDSAAVSHLHSFGLEVLSWLKPLGKQECPKTYDMFICMIIFYNGSKTDHVNFTILYQHPGQVSWVLPFAFSALSAHFCSNFWVALFEVSSNGRCLANRWH